MTNWISPYLPLCCGSPSLQPPIYAAPLDLDGLKARISLLEQQGRELRDRLVILEAQAKPKPKKAKRK